MKQRVSSLLIIVALLAAPLAKVAAAQNTIKVDEVKARAAEARTKAREVVVKMRPGTKILIGEKAFPFEFTRSASLSGRVKEIGENDFTFSSTSAQTGEVTAVISYTDVLSIKHPSGFEKAIKSIGRYSLIGMMLPTVLPLFLVLSLLGRLPKC